MSVLIATFVIWLLVIPVAVILATLALSTIGGRRLARAERSYPAGPPPVAFRSRQAA